MQKFKKLIPLTAGLAPFAAFAVDDVTSLIGKVEEILDMLVPLFIAVAVVVFLYGIIKYVTAGADEDKRTEGKNTMIYGIIGLFVMVAVWGLVNILLGTFNLNTNMPTPPTLPDV